MRNLSLLILAACCAATLAAQTTQMNAPETDPTTQSANLQPAHSPYHKPTNMRPAARPPASLRPPVQARVTTVERVAARGNQPPLKELPEFAAKDRDGHAVTTKSMQRTTHWLLIYTRENCLPCDRLMNVLAASENSALKGGQPYVILVGGKGPDALEKVRANFSPLSSATWLSDKDAKAFAALKPRGEPVIYAMEGNKISWIVPGNLGNPTRVLNMVGAWAASTGSSTPASPNVASTSTPTSAGASPMTSPSTSQ